MREELRPLPALILRSVRGTNGAKSKASLGARVSKDGGGPMLRDASQHDGACGAIECDAAMLLSMRPSEVGACCRTYHSAAAIIPMPTTLTSQITVRRWVMPAR